MAITILTPFKFGDGSLITGELTVVAATDGIQADLSVTAGARLIIDNAGASPAVVTITAQQKCASTGAIPTSRIITVPVGELWEVDLYYYEMLPLESGLFRVLATYDQVSSVSSGVAV